MNWSCAVFWGYVNQRDDVAQCPLRPFPCLLIDLAATQTLLELPYRAHKSCGERSRNLLVSTSPKARIAFFYIYIGKEQHAQLPVPTSHLQILRKYPRQAQLPTRNPAGFEFISGEMVDQGVVQGCGLDSGTREAIVRIPRTPNLLDIPESTSRFWAALPSNTHGN